MNRYIISYTAIILLLSFGTGCGNVSENTSLNNTGQTARDTATPTPESDAGPSAGGTSIASNDPAELIKDLYKQHDAEKGPFNQTDKAKVDKYFTKAFADLIHKDNNRPTDGPGPLGADPLYDGQDFEIKNFSVGKPDIKDDTATVQVTFDNFGEKNKVNFSLKLEGQLWKISDIKYSSGDSLFDIFNKEYGKGKTNAPPVENITGKFEGTYRVDDTTCTVKQSSEGVDVRWAKGSGVEKYAFEGRDGTGFNYVAPAKDGKHNVFTFRDESYDAGVFTRADGKVFNVSRAK